MKTLTSLAITLQLLTSAALADQFAWITRSDAERAASLIPVGSTVRLFCAPCGDDEATAVDVYRIESVSIDEADSWEVKVNGMGIDLAYTYVETDFGWQNLALMMGLDASDVPRTLAGTEMGDPQSELRAAELDLERLEAALAGTVPGGGRRLDDIRGAWEHYRNVQAELEATVFGSAAAGTRARLRITRARIAELESLLGP